MKEADIVRKMLTTLNSIPGVFALRTHGSAMQLRGTPDILGCAYGQFFAIEAKRDPYARPSAAQRYVLDQFDQAGAKTFVSCDPSAQEVVQWINSIKPS